MWLTGRLTPDFKTIANFRKDNGIGIRNVCRQFVLLCRNLNLFTQQLVAIDGSKFKAVNHRDRNFTKAKILARMQQIEESIDATSECWTQKIPKKHPQNAALRKLSKNISRKRANY